MAEDFQNSHRPEQARLSCEYVDACAAEETESAGDMRSEKAGLSVHVTQNRAVDRPTRRPDIQAGTDTCRRNRTSKTRLADGAKVFCMST